MMNGKYIAQDGKEAFYYMGCYGIGVSRTVAAIYEQYLINDAKFGPCGFSLPENIAPFQVQIVPKMEAQEKLELAEKIYSALQAKNIGVILDDRETITMGAKIRDCKVLGTPYLLVIGDKTDGTILELEQVKSGEKTPVTLEEMIRKFQK